MEVASFIDTFETGIAAYKAQNWEEAIATFESVRAELKPNDFASTMYIQRCEIQNPLVKHGPLLGALKHR